MFFSKVRKFILDTLFPIECLGCGKEDVWLCDKCFDKLPVNKNYFEPLDFVPSYLDGFFIAADWQDKILQEVIHKFKYNFVQELAQPLSQLLIKKLALIFRLDENLKNFIIIPVPLHKKRLVWRGFNQAELLARPVAEEFKMELANNLLKRIKNTSPQVKLKSEARLKNISGAFEVDKKPSPCQRGRLEGVGDFSTNGIKERIKETKFLLVDDVITSGATMNEMARVLKSHGAVRVWGLAVARG